MVSFETFRTFEMILAVSQTRLDSKRTSKDSLVENLTMALRLDNCESRIHWISVRTITSGSTHPPFLKKVEQVSSRKNALFKFLPFLKGRYPVSDAKIS